MDACRAVLTLHEADLASHRVAVIDARDGVPVAMAEIAPGRPVAGLHKMFVDPLWQARGLGRRLMAWATETARTMGAETLEIEANPGAAPFYERMGAVHAGMCPSEAIPGREIPLMHLRL